MKTENEVKRWGFYWLTFIIEKYRSKLRRYDHNKWSYAVWSSWDCWDFRERLLLLTKNEPLNQRTMKKHRAPKYLYYTITYWLSIIIYICDINLIFILRKHFILSLWHQLKQQNISGIWAERKLIIIFVSSQNRIRYKDGDRNINCL